MSVSAPLQATVSASKYAPPPTPDPYRTAAGRLFYISSKSNDHLIRKYSVIDRLFHIVIWPAARQQSAKKDKLNQIRRQRSHDTSITHTSHYIHVIRFTLATLRSFMDSRPLMKHNLYTPR